MQCAGDSRRWGQSPVDVDENNIVGIQYPPLMMSGHWSQEGEAKLTNTGTTVQITLEGNRTPATIRGGPLTDDVYELAHVEFRWGSSDCKGAEHTLNGTWFTMEAQAVHFNKRYENLEACFDERDGLAVCTYFLQVYQLPAWDEHPLFAKVTDSLHKVTQAGSSAKIPANCLCWMRQACQTPCYFTYTGSTTTWPYHECVTWIVFPEPLRISENQAQMFRMLRNKSGEKVPTIISTSSSGIPKWRQSPIDLNKIATWPKKYPPLLLRDYWLSAGSAVMTNTGRTVSIELSNRKLPSMKGGPLKDDEFQFMNLQFRWGPHNSRGAEHSINNIWYSMEAQAMHWNTRYGSIEKCYDKPDGIAILSYLMQVVGCPALPDNPTLTPITSCLHKIRKVGAKTSIASDCLSWMLEACAAPGYYIYSGSLTNPPYSECVIWMILPNAIRMSSRQHNKVMLGYTGLIGLQKTGQAPIDLDDTLVRPKRYPPLVFNGHWLKEGEATLFNTGVTVEVLLSGDRIPSTIFGGPLANDEYEFYNAHFHWGEENCRGAEHTINGTWFSMEGHVVHWNRKYLNFEECLKYKDGLCVLAYLFLVQSEIQNGQHTQFEKITENLQHVINAGSEKRIPSNSLCWMRLATHCSYYYVYQGSYNVGPHPECATWIIFPLIIPIRPCQVEEFRKLRNPKAECIKSNYRNIQLLRGRKIFMAIP
ncbi:hypothetical protein KM043_007021 [Ampulex compressa]|nr:hypothetical protein KM043_007021 [Ampulex compressa]